MKKILLIVFSVVLAIGSAICIFVAFKPKIVYATNVNILTNKLVLQVDEELYLSNENYCIVPANYNQRPVFSSSNDNIASVDVFSGKVNAKSIGSCNIIITVKTNETQTINNKISLEVIERKLYPTQIELNVETLHLYINQSVKLNTNIIGTTNILPTVSTTNNCIIYDFLTDTVVATKVGTDTMNITYKLSDGQTKTFTISISVVDIQKYSQNITIDMSKQNYVFLEYLTESSREECIVELSNSEVLSIINHEYKHISVSPIKQGCCTLIVKSPTSECTFYITIV